MTDQPGGTDGAAIEHAYLSGTLLEKIVDQGFVEVSDPLVATCVRQHNAGAIDLLSLIKSPEFTALEGHRFFEVQHFFNLAIPKLEAKVEDMAAAVAALVAKGGDDLAAYQPNAAFVEWCRADLSRARQLVEAAKAGLSFGVQFLTFALTAGNFVDEATNFVRNYADGRRISGVAALGRMNLSDPSFASNLFASLSFALDADGDDVLTANVLSAAADVAKKGNQWALPRFLDIVSRAAERGGPQTLFSSARVIWQYAPELTESSINALLIALERVNPIHKGIIRELDLALRKLLDTPYSHKAVEFVARILGDSDQLKLSEFESFQRSLLSSPQFPQVFVDWLVSGQRLLCEGLYALFRGTDRSERPIDVSLPASSLSSLDQVFLCRKCIGYFFLQPVIAGSVLVSVLRSCDQVTAGVVTTLLFDPLLVNYGGALVDYLRAIATDDPAQNYVQDALKRGEEYLLGLKRIGLVKELFPSEHERQLEHFRFSDEARRAHKAAMQQSIFYNLVHRSVLLYGRKSLAYVPVDGDRAKPVEMELKPLSVSMELPRMEIIDPVGLDIMLRTFRVERRAA